MNRAILFDWGDTLMKVFPEYSGRMKDWPQVEAVPGAAEILERLYPDWILCVATNAAYSEEADIRTALRRVDLERWIERVYCFKNVGTKKPAPEYFQHILKDLGLPPEQVIMVGDDYPLDIVGAQHAGLRTVWFNTASWVDFPWGEIGGFPAV